MLSAATRVLRLAFVPNPPKPVLEGDPFIEFVAYAAECALAGSLRLTADRLTDLLNGTDELELVEVVCLGLNGQIADADRAVLKRADLVAVKAGNPRGRRALRRPTRQVPVALGAGPYVMHGYLHGRPGADPMVDFARRPSMVPITDATIGYETTGGWQRHDASTLIVNRDAADWMRLATDNDLAYLARRTGAA
jgi:hypothetical protein